MRALVREPSPAISECALTFLDRRPIDFGRAVDQHRDYVAALQRLGIRVTVLPREDDLPDAVFVEDTAIVVDECAVITRPGVDSRRPEVDTIAAALEPLRPLTRIEAPGTLEGGDVLRIGRTVFVGRTARTNDAGITQLTNALAPYGYEVVATDLRGCLHLKSAATYAGMETVVLNPDWIDVDLFSRWQCVPVATEEPYGANVLAVE